MAVGILCGIGFTMSIFIATLAFRQRRPRIDQLGQAWHPGRFYLFGGNWIQLVTRSFASISLTGRFTGEP
ncbi:Na+/H+ antiporter NhaA [Escherichia coli]